MKAKPTRHFRKRVRERLGISAVEALRLYRAGRPATADDLPRFGRQALERNTRARVANHGGQEVLIITCPRGRNIITVLLTLPEWVALKSEQGNE